MQAASRYISRQNLRRFWRVAPYWVSFLLPCLVALAAVKGGWTLLLLPLSTWWLFGALDAALGRDLSNADPDAAPGDLLGYRVLTALWVPTQLITLFAAIWFAGRQSTLSSWETVGLFAGVGVMTGAIGINYAHELMHQSSRVERFLADVLLASVFYSHFRSEHLLVHHAYVATPKDPVTARYNEGFHRFFPRVLWQCPKSAFRAEAQRLSRKRKTWASLENPFFRYAALQLVMVLVAFGLAGWSGLGWMLIQAFVAIWQLELVNYVEHYGLTRRHLGEGRYEPVRLHHAWNASHRASNWLLINLQRHSDHHVRPDRRFPLLQVHPEDRAPELPFGYPVMTVLAMIPPLWRRIMNPRVRAWRRLHYPDIVDWKPYFKGGLPLPR